MGLFLSLSPCSKPKKSILLSLSELEPKIKQIMGKGDIKSRRGKIARGSYGVRRKRKTAVSVVIPPKKKAAAKPKAKANVEEAAEEKVTKKPVAKKTAAKKTTAKKATTTKKAASKKTADSK
ncbi:MAG: 30S ribosomal protein THX [Flavobacteriales bacterium]|nr:30S ribosomal protein THX [Flavobacteriales bacterium]